MLLAVLQPKSHFDSFSTFAETIESAVCREEFDVLVLPELSWPCKDEAITELAASASIDRIKSYVKDLSRRKHAVIGFTINTSIADRFCSAPFAVFDGKLCSRPTPPPPPTIDDTFTKACFLATEFVNVAVFSDTPSEHLLPDPVLEFADILMVSDTTRVGCDSVSRACLTSQSRRHKVYTMMARFAPNLGSEREGSSIVSPNGHVLIDAGAEPGLHMTEIPDFMPLRRRGRWLPWPIRA